jgi:ATP-dependent DNA ligase
MDTKLENPASICPHCGGSMRLAMTIEGDGEIVFEHSCKLGCEGIVSKRLGSSYRSGRADCWVKVKNPKAPAVTREAEADWGR